MPLLAQQADKYTLIRSMSYTPAGLFNHTAAIYQMLTGYPPDKVSPSGQLEPPSPRDFPTAGSQISKLKPLDDPMLPLWKCPARLQESSVIGKGGSAGFLGKAYDPYRLYQDPNKPIDLGDLALRSDVSPERLKERFSLLKGINGSMPELEKAVSSYALDDYYQKAYSLLLSGKARNAFDLEQEKPEVRDKYGRTTFGQGALLARRLVEAGTRFVQLNWPSVANGDPTLTAWDTHTSNFGPLKNLHCPVLDRTLSALLEDMIGARNAGGHAGGGGRRIWTFAAPGRQHFRQHQFPRWPRPLALLLYGSGDGGRNQTGQLYGKSDETASSPKENPVHPTELLATIYYALGIDPGQMVLNDLGQPRELVKGSPLVKLFA